MNQVTHDKIREYLESFRQQAANTYDKHLKLQGAIEFGELLLEAESREPGVDSTSGSGASGANSNSSE